MKRRHHDAPRDGERYYCPFPGCKRSFIELWRLKVHCKASPDIRGSGKERGHGMELTGCPRCYAVLRSGTHHTTCIQSTEDPPAANPTCFEPLSGTEPIGKAKGGAPFSAGAAAATDSSQLHDGSWSPAAAAAQQGPVKFELASAGSEDAALQQRRQSGGQPPNAQDMGGQGSFAGRALGASEFRSEYILQNFSGGSWQPHAAGAGPAYGSQHGSNPGGAAGGMPSADGQLGSTHEVLSATADAAWPWPGEQMSSEVLWNSAAALPQDGAANASRQLPSEANGRHEFNGLLRLLQPHGPAPSHAPQQWQEAATGVETYNSGFSQQLSGLSEDYQAGRAAGQQLGAAAWMGDLSTARSNSWGTSSQRGEMLATLVESQHLVAEPVGFSQQAPRQRQQPPTARFQSPFTLASSGYPPPSGPAVVAQQRPGSYDPYPWRVESFGGSSTFEFRAQREAEFPGSVRCTSLPVSLRHGRGNVGPSRFEPLPEHQFSGDAPAASSTPAAQQEWIPDSVAGDAPPAFDGFQLPPRMHSLGEFNAGSLLDPRRSQSLSGGPRRSGIFSNMVAAHAGTVDVGEHVPGLHPSGGGASASLREPSLCHYADGWDPAAGGMPAAAAAWMQGSGLDAGSGGGARQQWGMPPRGGYDRAPQRQRLEASSRSGVPRLAGMLRGASVGSTPQCITFDARTYNAAGPGPELEATKPPRHGAAPGASIAGLAPWPRSSSFSGDLPALNAEWAMQTNEAEAGPEGELFAAEVKDELSNGLFLDVLDDMASLPHADSGLSWAWDAAVADATGLEHSEGIVM